MKFVSKSTNLHVILQAGLPAQPISGIPEKPRVSVKFEGGIAEVKDEKLVEKMMNHPGFNVDFFLAEPGKPDPYAYQRGETEPAHQITEIQFGHPVARVGGAQKPQLSPEIRKLLQDEAAAMAKDMLKQMLPEAVKMTLEGLAQDVKDGAEAPAAAEEAPKASETPTAPAATRSRSRSAAAAPIVEAPAEA